MSGLLAIWAMSIPASFWAGKSFSEAQNTGHDWIPYLAAILPPFGAFCALSMIIQKPEEEDHHE